MQAYRGSFLPFQLDQYVAFEVKTNHRLCLDGRRAAPSRRLRRPSRCLSRPVENLEAQTTDRRVTVRTRCTPVETTVVPVTGTACSPIAWSLLGSQRSTQDIDVLLGCCDPAEVARVKECLRSHPHFVGYALKIYYTEVCDSDSVDLPEEEILQHLKSHPHNVLIETLAAGTLGLPTDLAEVYTPEGFPYIRILHPKILILTKLGRWRNTVISTRPKTRLRAQSDEEDLVYMIEWLAERDFTIAFDLYKANTRPRASLVKDVRMFWDKRISDCDDVTIGFLKRALAPPDREVIMKAQEEEGNIYEVARDAVDRPPVE